MLAPGYSWRKELRSFYAALLHTGCLSNREFLSRRRWMPLDAGLVVASSAAAPSTAAAAKPTLVPGTMRNDVPRAVAQAPTRVTLKLRPSSRAKRRASRYWHVMAASICIVGGVAVLAWIALDRYEAVRQMTGELPRPAAIGTGNHDGQAGTRQAAVGEESHAHAALRPADVASTIASTSTPPSAPVHGPVSGGKPAPSPSSQRTRVRHVTAMRATPDTSLPLLAQSTARTDAPFAQAWLDGNEYATITTSAATHPRAVTSNSRQASSDTEWMNYMTQRRVTEIPEQFTQ
ncbi:hypothetical protein [Paraburkholderia sp.]|uniref:hypothetical protein n=1 Tax=Paraburkholderia sp. TaxID=1926495 RepID=UPI0039E308FC